MAEFIGRIWHQIFSRSLGTSPMETVIFLALPVFFVAWLVLSNQRRVRLEKNRLKTAWEQKWKSCIRKFEISPGETALLEELSVYLENPDQKYILLVNNHLFDSCLRHHLKNGGTGDELARSILLKAGLKPVSEELKGITFMRRSAQRKRVDVEAVISHAEVGAEAETVRLFDLSSHGASVEKPAGAFTAGEDLKLEFTYGKHRYSITAEVVRVSENGSRLHLLFHRMKDSETHSA